jgi:hypothetical protein
VLPLVGGFAVLSACAMLVCWWAEGAQRAAVPVADADTRTGEIG